MEKIMWPCSRVGAVRTRSSAVTGLGLDGYDLHSSLGMWYRDKVRPRLSYESVRAGREGGREEGSSCRVKYGGVIDANHRRGICCARLSPPAVRCGHQECACCVLKQRSSKLVWEYFGESVPFKERPQTSSTYHGAFHLIWIARAQTNLKAQRNLMVIAKKRNTAA